MQAYRTVARMLLSW